MHLIITYFFFLFFDLTLGLPDSPLSTPYAARETPQYLVDISWRKDGQLEFTPNILQNVPAGAIIIFVAPTTTPFYLYETPYNPPQGLCASYKRINGLITGAGTSQIFVVTSGTDVMAHFACPAVTPTCICDGNSLFFLNPKSGIARSSIRPIIINNKLTTLSSSATGYNRASTPLPSDMSTSASQITDASQSTQGIVGSKTASGNESSPASKPTESADTQPSDVCS